MRVHFVAVAGTGMGALAGLWKSLGHDVSGSDVSFDPPMGPALEAWGIRLLRGFDAKHLEPAPDLVVIGNVCRKDNVEARAAIDGGLPYASMAHALAEGVLTNASPLVVGGTHGKTTTSAMCAHILEQVGLAPGFLIGGLPKNFPTSFRAPAKKSLPLASATKPRRRPPFVVEGDEYDTAFFEKTPKFWHYLPEVGILTSIEHDHIDIYPDEASYLAAFAGFIERMPKDGLLVAAANDAHVVRLAQACKAEVAYVALDGDETSGAPPHYLGYPATADESGQTFDIFVGGMNAGRAALKVPGHHNGRNALAAIAACAQGYGVDLKKVIDALATFEGVRRRQDLLFIERGVRVYDDFAHHPTAVRETLRALRTKHPDGRLFAVFEPRSATACRSIHQVDYVTAFDAATKVVLSPLGRTNVPEGERLDLSRLTKELKARSLDALPASSVDEIVDVLVRESRPGDTIALLSNGAFGGIYEKLKVAFQLSS
jgi:UDP-N-acetylmuramate: L-alanyl-gamma-D-glutamyl-meso-diaminopimelate ligase